VYVSLKKNKALLYNTLSGSKLEYDHPEVIRIIRKLMTKENLMVIELKKEAIENPVIPGFVEELKEYFMGDTAEAGPGKGKPIQIAPLPNLFSDFKRMKREPSLAGKSLMSYLSEVTLYINNHSAGNREVHSMFSGNAPLYRQFLFPFVDIGGERREMTIETIDNILADIKESGVYMLNVTGGNIFDHSRFGELLNRLGKYPFIEVFHAHYLDAIDSLNRLQSIEEKNTRIALYVTLPLIEDKFDTAVRLAGSRPDVSFVFAIADENDLEACEGIISRFNLESVQMKPYYNGKNLDFFQRMVFFDKVGLWEERPSQKEIFRRMSMNANEFGKLIFMSDGNIFANPNNPAIGKIGKNPIREAIYNELFKGKSWLRVRPGVQPCKGCLYNLLCPPISNYERVLGRYNLCDEIPWSSSTNKR
jgi:pseudo-rSAM protein